MQVGNRRDFLKTVAGTAVGSGFRRSIEKNSGAQARTPLDVALFLDVEDTFSLPEVGNDDSIKELATILTEEGLRAKRESRARAALRRRGL